MTRFGVTEKLHAWQSLNVRHNMSATNVRINTVADFSIFMTCFSQFFCMHVPSVLSLNKCDDFCFMSRIRIPSGHEMYYFQKCKLIAGLSPFLYFLCEFLINISLICLFIDLSVQYR